MLPDVSEAVGAGPDALGFRFVVFLGLGIGVLGAVVFPASSFSNSSLRHSGTWAEALQERSRGYSGCLE